MSTTIDNRVLEMRFDNKQFESGVATSMSTLDKLKQKLNLSGASKGLENVSAAAKNVNFSGMSSGIDTVSAKFSALQVAGVTALANIANSAVNAGKRMVKALTLDPITTGFNEYELKMNSVQTIMSNTASKGTTLSDVTKTLEELNTYADKTIYNFAEMTRNIGTFTAAGVGLEDSAAAIKGIANLAAASGSSSQQASTAMYQLSQALAAGTVKLMDWNSVVNAGMGGEKFQEALKSTAREMGIAVDDIIAKNGSFRDSLQDGWMTADVLNTTLNKFTVDGAKNYADAMVKAGKYTKEQADALVKEAQAMEDAATKVKTFTQLWDTMKESVQSGWAQTWEILLGDFEEAKELFSGLSDFFGNFISKSSETRNTILEGALSGNPFSKLAERLEKVTGATDKMTSATEKASDATKKYGEVVDRVIGGEFGNGEARFNALAKAGYDWAHVQNLVNEKLGDSTRYATDYKESQEELSKSQNKVNEAQKVTIEDLLKMSDAQLKNLGFTKDEVEAFRELETQSKKTGIPIKDLVKDLDQLNGRTLLLNSFKNAGQGLVTVLSSIRDGWREAFYGDASDEEILQRKTERLYDMIAAIHKFSTYLTVSDATADKLKRTFKGLFAIVDILTTILGGGFKLAFTGLSKILGEFDMNILDLTANIGDAIVAFRDFLFDNELINKGFELLALGIKKAINAIQDFCKWFSDIPQVQNVIEGIKNAFDSLKDIDLSEVGQNIIDGLQNGLGDGITAIWDKMVEIGQGIIDAIKGILGIHSPSTVMIAIGGFIIAGLVIGLLKGSGEIWDAITEIGSGIATKFQEIVGNIPWSKLFAAGVAITMAWFVKQIADAINGISNVFDGLGDILENAGTVLKKFSKVLNSISWDFKAKAIQKLAISLAILVGAVIALTYMDTGNLWNAVGVIAALSAILGVLAFATDKMSEASVKIGKNGANINGLKSGLIAIGAAILLMAATVKMVGSLDTRQAIQGFIGLTALVVEMGVFLAAFSVMSKIGSMEHVGKMGSMLLKMSIALMLMVGVCKLVGMLSAEDMLQGAAFASAFVVFATLLGVASKIAGPNANDFGKMAIKMSTSMMLMVGVCKLVGMLSAEDMLQGAAFASAFVVFVGLLGLATRTAGKNIPKLGGLLLSMSVSMGLMVGVCKLVGTLSAEEMTKGAAFVTAFMLLVKVLVSITTIGSEQQMAKVAGTILAMSVAIGVLAAVSIAISLIDLGGLAKGIVAVGMLGGIMSAMIYATRGANNVKGNLIAMTVAIGVMAGAIAALSLIDTSKLVGASASLSLVMGAFALVAKSAGVMGKAMGSLAIMTVAVGVLAGILYMLSSLEVESNLGTAASLSMLLLSLSASMSIASGAGVMATKALVPMAAMTLVVGALAGIIGLLAKCDVGSTLDIAASLSMLLLSLSASCAILAGVGVFGPAALIGIASLGVLIVGVGGLITAIGALATHFPKLEEFLNKGLPLLEKIGYGLGSFFGGIVSGFSSAVLDILPKFGTALSSFMVGLQPFIALAGNVDSNVLVGVGYLSAAIMALSAANFVSGVSQFLSFGQSFADMGTQLSEFITNALPFLTIVKTVDPSSVECANSLAKMILALTAADLMSGISKFVSIFTGGSNFDQFGTQLTSFGKAVVGFSKEVKGNIDPESVEAAANAGKAMAKLAEAIPKSGGFLQDIVGEADLEKFGTMCKAFGKAIKDMSASLTGEGGAVLINEEAINAAVTAGKAMSKLANAIPKSEGFLQDIVGEADLQRFGVMCIAFGSAIRQMSASLVGEGGAVLINEEAINSAVRAGTAMSKLANALPKSEGFLQDVVGTQDLQKFGETCKAFGSAIKTMSASLTGEGGAVLINEEAITAVSKAGKAMAAIQEAIPENTWFDGKVDLDDFGEKIKKFGKHLVGYSEKVTGIDSEAISSSATQAKKLVEIAKSVVNLNVDGIENFKSIKTLGEGIRGYADKVAGIDTSSVSSSISAIRSLISAINSMASLDTSGVGSFTTAINNLGKIQIDGVIKAFSGASSQMITAGGNLIESLARGMRSRQSMVTMTATAIITSMSNVIRGRISMFQSIGTQLMSRFVSGIKSQSINVISATTSTLGSAANAARRYYGAFYSSGSYVASGFAAGIRANISSAASAAASMAAAASAAARANLKINSPSKVFRDIGSSVPEGFAMGISMLGRVVKKSTVKMANTAVDGSKSAMTRISDLLNSDIDTQPVIRPVLDLDDVKSGMNGLGRLLNTGSTIGVSTNVERVGMMMNHQTRVGGMADVVSAIDSLRKDIREIEPTQYNVNGITYDDGSSIKSAIETIIRATMVEGRA